MRRRDMIVGIAVISMSLGAGVIARNHFRKDAGRFKPYTIVWQATKYDSEGKAIPDYMATRYQASDGRWHQVKKWPDGQTEESFADPNSGVFNVKKNSLSFLSTARTEPLTDTLEDLQKSGQFVRFETVQNMNTAVLKTGDDDTTLEVFRAPDLNNDSLKMIIREPTYVWVMEPVSIQYGEPEPAVFKHPDLPINYQNFDQLHGREKRP